MKENRMFLPFVLMAASVAFGEETRPNYLAVGLSSAAPSFTRFAVDSLGQGKLEQNPVMAETNTAVLAGLELTAASVYAVNGKPVWTVACGVKSVVLSSDYTEGVAVPPFTLTFDQKKNHATLLGLMKPGHRRMTLPCVLHLPDMGSLRITGNVPGLALEYDARRFVRPAYVRIAFPSATAERRRVEYRLEVTAIHPAVPGIEKNPLYDGFRRNWLNIFQVNPRIQMLANNAASDACSFTLFEYADLAVHTPPLADGLTALDLVRMTLDRYLAGVKGYGQVGYACTPTDADLVPWKTQWTSLDTLPSLLISACHYAKGSGDAAWARENYGALAAWGREMFASDKDGNGLIEYPGTGNYGDRPLADRRPSNWWDCINFGHEDAFANALAYRAATLFAELARQLKHDADALFFADKAAKLREAYAPAFLNPATGMLAGWRSADGRLHDYGFTYVQGMAITFGLLDDKTANSVMDRLLAKMEEVGYTRFEIGLPGNLVPVKKGDYVEHDTPPEVHGVPRLEDGSDGFQFYENGGTSGCWTYYTVKALYRLGRVGDARRIFHPMLQGYACGEFQGFGANGMSRDWRDWKGGCHGYEGLLVDNYHALLAVMDDVAVPAAVKPAARRAPPLWAMYYLWYSTEQGPRKQAAMWVNDRATGGVPGTPRGKAQPLLGYYDSEDPAVARWHMRLAKASGIDAFLVDWWGGGGVGGAAFEKTVLPIAVEENFKVAMCSELAQFHQDVTKLAKETAETLKRMKDSPAYLRMEGKPVVYLYQVPFDPKLTVETFEVLRSRVERENGPVYWLFDKVTNVGNKMDIPKEWLAVQGIPMFGFYGTFSIKREWTYERLLPDYKRVADAAHAAGKRICLPVHPGHDNSGFRPNDNFAMPRDNGETLKGYLRLATDAGADAIMLTSFNEWPETTVVEPSSSWADPYQYLKILAEWKGIPFVTPVRLK